MVGLIGAVDVGIDLADLVQVEHPDAGGLESLRSIHCELDTAPASAHAARREFVDEEVHRRAGADTEHLSRR